MSYCRWSSDGFQCDVYVHESDAGWITHVAAKRRAERAPELDWSTPERWTQTQAAQRGFLDDPRNPLLPIGLSEDGTTFCDPSPADCAAQLLRLKDVGYHVPQDAIDALLEEANAEPEDETTRKERLLRAAAYYIESWNYEFMVEAQQAFSRNSNPHEATASESERSMIDMKTYETVAKYADLTPKTRQRYIAYMRHRWPQEEALHCQVGYAMEWAERFRLGIEYMASDSAGQRFLKTYNKGAQP